MSLRLGMCLLIAYLLNSLAAINCSAGVFNLDAIASGDTAYYEYGADGFFRMDLYDPPPRQTQQRFHAISDPSVQFGNLAFDGFPNDQNFKLGNLSFDDSTLVAGTGIANVTGINLGIVSDPTDPTYINYGRWTNVLTAVDSFAGTVTLSNGFVTGINLVTSGRLLIPNVFTPDTTDFFTAPGTFNITGTQFAGNYVVPDGIFGGGAMYDLKGTIVTAVPEPSTLFLAGLLIPAVHYGKKRFRKQAA
jgi:hypothetical protein